MSKTFEHRGVGDRRPDHDDGAHDLRHLDPEEDLPTGLPPSMIAASIVSSGMPPQGGRQGSPCAETRSFGGANQDHHQGKKLFQNGIWITSTPGRSAARRRSGNALIRADIRNDGIDLEISSIRRGADEWRSPIGMKIIDLAMLPPGAGRLSVGWAAIRPIESGWPGPARHDPEQVVEHS